MRKLALFSLLVLFSIVAAVPALAKNDNPKQAVMAAAGAKGQGKALFERKCGVCHGLSLATSRTATKAQWRSIVADMQAKRPGWISQKEAAKILDYLSSAYGR